MRGRVKCLEWLDVRPDGLIDGTGLGPRAGLVSW